MHSRGVCGRRQGRTRVCPARAALLLSVSLALLALQCHRVALLRPAMPFLPHDVSCVSGHLRTPAPRPWCCRTCMV